MPRDTLTFSLAGDVTLADFARAMRHFSGIVHGLSEEVAESVEIEWEISRLEAGSATAVVRGISAEPEAVARVAEAYLATGQALAADEPIPYSGLVADEARAVARILNGRIRSIRFIVEDQEATVVRPPDLEADREEKRYSFGVVAGKVQTLSDRRRLFFTLYDDLFDRAVTCYLSEERREMMRGAWGKRVAVTGHISRDPDTGRPQTIRDIELIDLLEVTPPGSYRRALGVLPWEEGDPMPEDVIRQMRDVD